MSTGVRPQNTSNLWKKVLGGLVAALLLLPVPAFATLSFGPWGIVTGSSTLNWPFYTVTPSSPTLNALRIVPTTTSTTTSPASFVLESTLTTDNNSSGNTLNVNFSNFGVWVADTGNMTAVFKVEVFDSSRTTLLQTVYTTTQSNGNNA